MSNETKAPFRLVPRSTLSADTAPPVVSDSASEAEPEAEPAAKDVERIMESSGIVLRDEKDVEDYVEYPLRSACLRLLKKNVKTTTSSANTKEGRSDAYIGVDARSLSERNKAIAINRGGEYSSTGHGGDAYTFSLNITQDTPTQVIQQYFDAIANAFESQEPTWIRGMTLEDIAKMCRVNLADLSANEKDGLTEHFVLEDDGLYYEDARDVERVAAWKEQGKSDS